MFAKWPIIFLIAGHVGSAVALLPGNTDKPKGTESFMEPKKSPADKVAPERQEPCRRNLTDIVSIPKPFESVGGWQHGGKRQARQETQKMRYFSQIQVRA